MAQLLIVGLEAAGKTTILHKLKLGEVVTTTPAVGLTVEAVEYKKVRFIAWDMKGPDEVRRCWRQYYQGTRALIFVVDSQDRGRIDVAREELQNLLAEEELCSAVVLVLANKQDLPGAMSTSEVTEKLGLLSEQQKKWKIQGSCATTGDGLYECMDWLAYAIQPRR